jgi:hypothetical protein
MVPLWPFSFFISFPIFFSDFLISFIQFANLNQVKLFSEIL